MRLDDISVHDEMIPVGDHPVRGSRKDDHGGDENHQYRGGETRSLTLVMEM